jgi:hypothetical protein
VSCNSNSLEIAVRMSICYVCKNFGTFKGLVHLGHVVWIESKKNETGEAFETLGTREVYTGFCWGEIMEGDHLEDLGVDGWIILRWIFRKWIGGGGGS